MAKLSNLKIELEKLDEPRKPDPEECCGNGCVNCVKVIYYEKLDEFEQEEYRISMEIYSLLEEAKKN